MQFEENLGCYYKMCFRCSLQSFHMSISRTFYAHFGFQKKSQSLDFKNNFANDQICNKTTFFPVLKKKVYDVWDQILMVFSWITSHFLIILGSLNINEEKQSNFLSLYDFFVQKGKEFINYVSKVAKNVYYFKTD